MPWAISFCVPRRVDRDDRALEAEHGQELRNRRHPLGALRQHRNSAARATLRAAGPQ